VNSLPKTATRQRRDCDLNPGPSVPVFYLYLFRELTYRSDQSMDFHAYSSNDADSRKGVHFGGFVDIASHFGGEIPKNNFFGVNRRFQAIGQNIESIILSKLLHRFQPNDAQRWRRLSSHRAWSQYAPNKSRGPICKISYDLS